MRGNIIHAVFNGNTVCDTLPLYQYDYGQYLIFDDVDLPDVYEVYFANSIQQKAKIAIGNSEDGVLIPDEFLTKGKNIVAWVFVSTYESQDSGPLRQSLPPVEAQDPVAISGQTEYVVHIPVRPRSQENPEKIKPEEHDVIADLIGAMNHATETAEAYAGDAETQAENAAASAREAESFVEIVSGYADQAQAAATDAEDASAIAETSASQAVIAQAAAENAQSAAEQAADEASQYASDVQGYVETAQTAASDASASAFDASEAAAQASQAAEQAQDASIAAETSKNEAIQASTDAEIAKDNAVSAKEDAVAASEEAQAASITAVVNANLAETAAEQAESSKTQAQGYAQEAQEALEGMDGIVEAATEAKNAAISASNDAYAARDVVINIRDNFVVDSEMSEESENPVQNKVVTQAISDAIGLVDEFPSDETALSLLNEEILNTTWEGMVVDILSELMQGIPSDDTLIDIVDLLAEENTILDLIYKELAISDGPTMIVL